MNFQKLKLVSPSMIRTRRKIQDKTTASQDILTTFPHTIYKERSLAEGLTKVSLKIVYFHFGKIY